MRTVGFMAVLFLLLRNWGWAEQPSSEVAAFLAGLRVDKKSPLRVRQQTAAYREYALAISEAWSGLEKHQTARARRWANLRVPRPGPVVFYPFGGPDFVYASSCFPNATTYVLVGLEPVGRLRRFDKMSDAELSDYLYGMRNAMAELLQLTFFKTNDMGSELASDGVLPLLLVFVARDGGNVRKIDYVALSNEGQLKSLGSNKNGAKGVRVEFIRKRDKKKCQAIYFSVDLSNSGLQKYPPFVKYVRQMKSPSTFTKAASYLMHYDDFSTIRTLVLDRSRLVLQDDSGVPYRFFSSKRWKVSLYGRYRPPVKLFANMGQSDLEQAYYRKTAGPIDFGFGYQQFAEDSNLLLAIRR